MMPGFRPGQARARGAAMLLAMLILTVVVTVTAGMAWQQRRSIEIEAAERGRDQSAWILAGGLSWARVVLRNAARSRPGQTWVALDETLQPLEEFRLSSFLAVDKDNNVDSGPDAFMAGQIVDAQSLLNLRSLVDAAGKVVPAQRDALARLGQQLGLPSDTADLVAEGLRQAWTGAAAGASSEAVADAPLPPARVDDLTWLGVAPATVERLKGFVEILPRATPVNVNTASREVLMAAIDGLDAGSADRLVASQQRQPHKTLETVRLLLPAGVALDANRVGVGSRYFLVTGRLRLDDRVVTERTLVERMGAERDFDVVALRRERLRSASSLP